MATITVKNAGGGDEAIEKPLAAGRAAAAASNPVALSTEDKAKLDAIAASLDALDNTVGGGEMQIDVISSALPAGGSTSANQVALAELLQALDRSIVGGPSYEAVAASSTDTVLGGTGAIGDKLATVTIIPASLSPGAVSIKDGSGSAITLFAGGASSIATLHPFTVPLSIVSLAGAWKITTGSNVSVIATGDFA